MWEKKVFFICEIFFLFYYLMIVYINIFCIFKRKVKKKLLYCFILRVIIFKSFGKNYKKWIYYICIIKYEIINYGDGKIRYI